MSSVLPDSSACAIAACALCAKSLWFSGGRAEAGSASPTTDLGKASVTYSDGFSGMRMAVSRIFSGSFFWRPSSTMMVGWQRLPGTADCIRSFRTGLSMSDTKSEKLHPTRLVLSIPVNLFAAPKE